MTKADLDSRSVEAMEPAEKEVEKEQKESLMSKRIRRYTWVLTMIVAGSVCFLSAQRYCTWMVQTVIDRTDVHISEIPFPAVTLCPVMDIYELISPFHGNDTEEINRFLRNLEEVVPKDDDGTDFNNEGLRAMEYINYIDNEDILNKIYFKCEDFFVECTWRRTKRNCCGLFRPIQIRKNLCYAFNALGVEDPDPTWPWSETLSGRKSGLRVVMDTKASKAMTRKVMAMIHYPEEVLSGNTLYLEGEVHITLDALKFYADTTIGQLRAEYRRCYFADEITKFHKTPCQCYEDCRIAYMERVCNCTPKVPKTKLQKVFCNTTHLPCIYEHKGVFLSSGNIHEKNVEADNTEFIDCKCFPNCNYVQYKTFIRYDLNTNQLINNNSMVDLEIHFLRETIFGYRRAMVYSLLDLFVAICSIIALFLGVSFISVVTAIQNHCAKRRKAKALATALAKTKQNK